MVYLSSKVLYCEQSPGLKCAVRHDTLRSDFSQYSMASRDSFYIIKILRTNILVKTLF